jgi:hypothetical protein
MVIKPLFHVAIFATSDGNNREVYLGHETILLP